CSLRPDGLACQYFYQRLFAADTLGQSRRADTARSGIGQDFFYNPVFQGMKSNYGQPASRVQAVKRLMHGFFQGSQFIVDSDPQSLEGATRRVGAVAPGPGGNS